MTKAIDAHLQVLKRLFTQSPIAMLEQMQRALGTSGRTVLRVLNKLGYLTSYSHAGRFYTLQGIPRFDFRGLWSHDQVRFSSHGTLRATLVYLVKQAQAGYTHEELQVIVGLRVHDTLHSLVEAAQIGRVHVAGVFVYVDVDPQHANAQLTQRSAIVHAPRAAGTTEPPPDPAHIIDILVAVIHHPDYPPSGIVRDLRARSVQITEAQVEHVLVTYGVKKTVRSRCKRSRRCAKRQPR